MAEINLHLNPALKAEDYAQIYARDGLVRVENVLPEPAAQAIADVLARSTPWRLVFPEPDPAGGHEKIVTLTRADMQALGPAGLQQRLGPVMERARDNYGFLYFAYPMISAYMKGEDPGHPLHRLTEFLNSTEFLEFGRKVIGADKITKADAQATFYNRGHFLTRHTDEGHDRERRAAYTFGFTPKWEPDWGGLLMFLDDSLEVSRGLLPRFNMLSLFDGTRVHTVSPVSPFAGGPRLQITGWLRDDPPVQG
ncbi:MAG: 2OG-Fe(II) oxygenase family protein [Oceanicaulis sp.]